MTSPRRRRCAGSGVAQIIGQVVFGSGITMRPMVFVLVFERLAHYYCEINVLHPFRVGSGLAQRIFFEQLAIHAGYQLSWQGIEKEAWNQANQSGAMGDLTALQMIFSKVVSEAGESE